jgi:type I restriction-modification system DNA methylase subunit
MSRTTYGIYERYLGSNDKSKRPRELKLKKARGKEAGAFIIRLNISLITSSKIQSVRSLKARRRDRLERIKVLDPACGSGSFLLGRINT